MARRASVVVRRVEGAEGTAEAAAAAVQRRDGVAGAAQELPARAGRVAPGAAADRGRAAAAHQEGADGGSRWRAGRRPPLNFPFVVRTLTLPAVAC
jgi:hypothetical protein